MKSKPKRKKHTPDATPHDGSNGNGHGSNGNGNGTRKRNGKTAKAKEKSATPFYNSTHTRAAQRMFLASIAQLKMITEAAADAGVDRQSHYTWLRGDPAYAAAFDAAISQGNELIDNEILRRGVTGWKREVYQGGVLVGTITEYSDKMLELAAKSRMDKYRDKSEVTFKDGDAITDVELVAAIRQVLESAETSGSDSLTGPTETVDPTSGPPN